MLIPKTFIRRLVASCVLVIFSSLLWYEYVGMQFIAAAYGQSTGNDEISSFRGRREIGDGKTVVRYEWQIQNPGGKLFRRFTDTSGKHSVEARLDKFDVANAKVYLHEKDGKKLYCRLRN